MDRRALLKGMALGAISAKAFAQEQVYPSPPISSDRQEWSVLDFSGRTFRSRLQNALEEGAASGINIRIPSGKALDLDAPIELNARDPVRVSLTGEGMGATLIRCYGGGINIHGGAGSQYSLRGLSFVPQRPDGGTALSISWTEATTGKGFALEDVGFGASQEDRRNYFTRCLEVRNKGNGQIIGCWFNGKADEDPQGDGVVLAAANDVLMTATYMYNLGVGCSSDGPTSLEGFRMHGCFLVRVGRGLHFVAKPKGIPQIEVALSHINASYEAINIEGYSQVNLVDNLIYARNDIEVGDEQTDITLNYCPSATIERNKFFSGMDRRKYTKTAIRLIGSVRNGRVAENLASERTVFLDVRDDGVSGAQDLIISKNRAERDLKGNETVSTMYRFTESELHRRITWEGYGDELATIATVGGEIELPAGEWVTVPFVSDPALDRLGINFKPSAEGEFAAPAGVSQAEAEVRIKVAGDGRCEARILLSSGVGYQEIAASAEEGPEADILMTSGAFDVAIGNRIRVEVRATAGGVIVQAPAMTKLVLRPR